MTEKDLWYCLDDLQDIVCKIDLMIQGYISYSHEGLCVSNQETLLSSEMLNLSESIEELKNKLNKEGE